MKKVLISFVILLIFACSGDGIEGNVGDILKVSVENNEENTKLNIDFIDLKNFCICK